MDLKDVKKLSQLDLAFVKDYLKIDYDDDDAELEFYIVAAKSFIINQLNIPLKEIDTKPDIIIAVLLIIAHFYENKTVMHSGTKFNNNIDFILQQILIQYRRWL